MTGTIDPARFGMPDATTAGVQAGVTLTNYTGPMTITTAGAVIENKIINGTLTVAADNVTIKNCIVQNFDTWGILSNPAVMNTRVEYCDIDGTGSTKTSGLGIGGGNSAIIGCDIKGMTLAVQLFGAAQVRDNYIHNLADASSNPLDRHFDGITVFGGRDHGGYSGTVIEHNTIFMPVKTATGDGGTAAVFIKTEFGPIDGVQVKNNLMTGDPSYPQYVETANSPITNVTVENNYVERGLFGYFNVANSTPIIRNNVQWNNDTDPTPYPSSVPSSPSTPSSPSSPSSPTAPSAPTIASFSNDTGRAGDGVTNDNTVELKGTAAAGSTVKIYDGSTQIGSTTATSTGSWDYITQVLTDAKHTLTATATNSSGQASAASAALVVTVDTKAPAVPTMATPTNNANGGLNLTGTAEASSVVKVLDGTTQIGTATANSSGVWGYTTGALAAGSHSLTAQATDAAGNTGAASAVVKASTGTSAPPAPPTAPTPTPSKPIESAGATSLVESGDKFYLNSSSGSGPSLKYGGKDFVDGTDGTWAPIGAEKTATGYQVAWKEASTGLYTAWNTDNNGNYVSHVITLTGSVSGGSVSGTNYALKLLETSFHQDLNGNGQIGASGTSAPPAPPTSPTPTPSKQIESAGATSLVESGDKYYLNSSSGSGPSLKYGGANFVDGQFGTWAPIGAEKTATGYQVAWKEASTGQYTAWNTDNNGNFVSHVSGLTSGVSGTNSALKSLETGFHQDLNGDGQIGLVTTAVETQGSTDLTHAADHYFLYDSVGSGPSLKYGGADFVDGQFGTWAPIGAEKTATGYQVAWKEASTGQYTAWNTDNNGNFVSHVSGLTSGVSGTNSALKSLETGFHQDLNGDGQIGASSAAAPTSSVASASSAAAPTSSVALTTMYENRSDIVTIKGVADANSQIKLSDGNTSLGTVNTAADGTWSFATSSAVSDTVHTYTAQQIDSAGHVVATSGNAILGSTGSNTLTGTTGNDIFVGSGQGDTFVFAANFGRDVIKDFVASGSGQDTIQFSKTVFDSFANVLSHASQVGEDVAISTGHDTLTLKNTKLGALTSNDFHFA